MKNKGFSLIEVIIAITILSVIVSGITFAFVIPLRSDTSVEMKLLAYTYSQKEMEMITNSPFNTNFGFLKQIYSLDNKFQYEIIQDQTGDSNLKTITIRFFEASSLAQISEINTTIRNLYINEPTIIAALDPSTIYSGQSSILSWTTTNATSLTISPDIGNISAGEVASGSRTVSPSTTTIYTLTASGPGGTSSTSVTLTIVPPGPPIVSALLNPTFIDPGLNSILSWTTTNATSLTISPGIGNIPAGEVASGSRTVSPSTTTIYTLTASNSIGSTSTSVTLTVGYLETFNDGYYTVPPFFWTNSPSGQWEILSFDGSPASRFNHRTQLGTSYPSSGWTSSSNNYFVEGKVYLYRAPGDSSAVTSWAAIGGRCNPGGTGYYVRIDVEPSIPGGRTRISLMSTDTTLLQTPYNSSLFFNQWVTLKLEMIGTNISYYFNNTLLGTVANHTAHTTGSPYLRAENNSPNRLIYFDDIRIEFR